MYITTVKVSFANYFFLNIMCVRGVGGGGIVTAHVFVDTFQQKLESSISFHLSVPSVKHAVQASSLLLPPPLSCPSPPHTHSCCCHPSPTSFLFFNPCVKLPSFSVAVSPSPSSFTRAHIWAMLNKQQSYNTTCKESHDAGHPSHEESHTASQP